MNKVASVLMVGLIIVVTPTAGVGQSLGIDTDLIESLIDEWNFANNTRNVHSFEKVYGDQIMFYTENVSKRRAIALKQQLFELKPYFRQRIITEISYKPYSKGVIKCDFTKEVFEKTYWKKYPSYLLVSYEKNNYSIVGESDYATDRVLKYKLDIGEPITFEKAAEVPDTFIVDSAQAVTPVSARVRAEKSVETSASRFTIDDFEMLFSDISSMGMITIPRAYIFILVGMLALGGLMIVLADSVRKKGPVRERPALRHSQAEHVVRDFKVQSGFESFVLTLFDPLFFKYKRLKNEHVYAGKGPVAEKGADFVFEYNQKDTAKSFAIKCQYYKNVAKSEVQIFTGERLEFFRQFEDETDMDVYYVLGFGGAPDDPRELFFIPAKNVRSEYMSKAALRQYSKSGMFYYNRRTGKIQ